MDEDAEKLGPWALVAGVKNYAAPVENSIEVSQKTKNRTTV